MNFTSCPRTITIEVFKKWGKLFERLLLRSSVILSNYKSEKGRMKKNGENRAGSKH